MSSFSIPCPSVWHFSVLTCSSWILSVAHSLMNGMLSKLNVAFHAKIETSSLVSQLSVPNDKSLQLWNVVSRWTIGGTPLRANTSKVSLREFAQLFWIALFECHQVLESKLSSLDTNEWLSFLETSSSHKPWKRLSPVSSGKLLCITDKS